MFESKPGETPEDAETRRRVIDWGKELTQRGLDTLKQQEMARLEAEEAAQSSAAAAAAAAATVLDVDAAPVVHGVDEDGLDVGEAMTVADVARADFSNDDPNMLHRRLFGSRPLDRNQPDLDMFDRLWQEHVATVERDRAVERRSVAEIFAPPRPRARPVDQYAWLDAEQPPRL
jgi:hypothetical protein